MVKNRSVAELAREIDIHLRAVQQALRQPIENEIAKGGLTAPQVNVLQALVRRPGLSLRELSAAIELAHSTASGIVDRLEARGLVERRPDTDDGRVTRLYPGKAVREYVKDVLPGMQMHPLVHALEDMKPAERLAVLHALQRLREALGA